MRTQGAQAQAGEQRRGGNRRHAGALAGGRLLARRREATAGSGAKATLWTPADAAFLHLSCGINHMMAISALVQRQAV